MSQLSPGILKHTQLNMHDPENGVFGDCWRTTVAALLRLPIEAVPHVCDGPDDGKAGDRMRAFLAGYDHALLQVPFTGDLSLEQILDYVGSVSVSGGLHWCLMGTSRSGCNHVVICKGSEIVHDPSITKSGIIGPADDGLWWAEWIVRRPACDASTSAPVQRAALEKAIDFIEDLTRDPLLMGMDDIEMTLEDVQEHARIELASIRKLMPGTPIGVRCTGCGSTLTDEELAEVRRKKPSIRSCCPERDMVPVYGDTAAPVPHLEGLEAKLRMIVSHATMGRTDGEGLSVNDICVQITALRNELYQKAKADGPAPVPHKPSVQGLPIEDSGQPVSLIVTAHEEPGALIAAEGLLDQIPDSPMLAVGPDDVALRGSLVGHDDHGCAEGAALSRPGAPGTHLEGPQPCGIADPSTRDCPNMKEVGGGMDGERYRCAVCGKGYFLDYEEMK